VRFASFLSFRGPFSEIGCQSRQGGDYGPTLRGNREEVGPTIERHNGIFIESSLFSSSNNESKLNPGEDTFLSGHDAKGRRLDSACTR